MARQQAAARKSSRSKRARQQESDVDDEPRTEADEEFDDEVDDEPEAEADEELEDEVDDEPDEEFEDEEDDEPEDEEDDEPEDEGDADEEEPAESGVSAFEEEMHELQADLGDDWILSFTVQGDEAWLTAEKSDGSQHLEAPTADVLREAVELLEEGGGRSD